MKEAGVPKLTAAEVAEAAAAPVSEQLLSNGMAAADSDAVGTPTDGNTGSSSAAEPGSGGIPTESAEPGPAAAIKSSSSASLRKSPFDVPAASAPDLQWRAAPPAKPKPGPRKSAIRGGAGASAARAVSWPTGDQPIHQASRQGHSEGRPLLCFDAACNSVQPAAALLCLLLLVCC